MFKHNLSDSRFFTSPESIPFETIRQGMTLYPDWKMVVNKGN